MSFHLAPLTCITLLAASATVLAADPILGTWKLNVAKSKATGMEMLKSQVITYSALGGGEIRYVGHLVDSKGTKIERSWVSKRDGREVPFKSEFADTIAHTASPDGYSGTYVVKKAGKVVVEGKSVISRDGKVMTWTTTGMTADGKPTTGTWVFDRQ